MPLWLLESRFKIKSAMSKASFGEVKLLYCGGGVWELTLAAVGCLGSSSQRRTCVLQVFHSRFVWARGNHSAIHDECVYVLCTGRFWVSRHCHARRRWHNGLPSQACRAQRQRYVMSTSAGAPSSSGLRFPQLLLPHFTLRFSRSCSHLRVANERSSCEHLEDRGQHEVCTVACRISSVVESSFRSMPHR